MAERILLCPKCRYPATVVEDVTGYLEWGYAVIDGTGILRPADPEQRPPTLMADNCNSTGRIRACCANTHCRHQWALRRPFEPTATTTEEPGR
ncbi:hypothetical protein OOK13_40365 [Streptomyces sp. NBC_00378]|uniref:hypothetical protein n=1 Tax=unclassified Streptomyces TaxID=2593676 RepID=UPI00224E4A0F|nr:MULTISPECIES: hypothetical protein [unclassified Streptomyces]MCX5112188.1 hypothetical protein [Streptomyces sp. NBC_00378]MCX5114617.1 hypothetical protein [Streptomyces sp. NBC_00378]